MFTFKNTLPHLVITGLNLVNTDHIYKCGQI